MLSIIKIFFCILIFDSFILLSLQQKVTFPLYGSIYSTAYWFVDLYFGIENPHRVSLIVDTGSSVLGFPCSTCGSYCGKHIDKPYEISHATNQIQCQRGCILCAYEDEGKTGAFTGSDVCAYHIEYIEGSSLTGRWYQDDVILQTHQEIGQHKPTVLQSARIPIGCHSEETDQFRKQLASGILGLEADSHFGPPTFVLSILAELLKQSRAGQEIFEVNMQQMRLHTIPLSSEIQPEFSLCFSKNGGSLTIGGDHSEFHIVTGGSRRLEGETNIPSHSQSLTNYILKTAKSFFTNLWNKAIALLSSMNDYDQRTLRKNSQYFVPLFEQINQSNSRAYTQQSSVGRKKFETSPQIQWTPMIAVIDQEGHYDTYMVFLEKWIILPSERIQAGQYATLNLPPVSLPSFMGENYYFMTPLKQQKGLLCLVDSGTTLTHLPLALYIQFWVELNKYIIKKSTVQHYKEISGSRNAVIRRISGSTVDTLYRQAIERITVLKNRNKDQSLEDTLLYDSQIDHIQQAIDVLKEFNSSSGQSPQIPSVNEPFLKYTHDQESDDSGINALDSFESSSSAELHSNPVNNKTIHRRILGETVELTALQEECWKLHQLEKDFQYFPTLILKFADSLDFKWKPEAYLYRRGKSNFYCLTITSKPDRLNQGTRLSQHQRDRQANKRRLQHEQDASIILGSSFFINHDIIFHIGAWALGTADAKCPETKLLDRIHHR